MNRNRCVVDYSINSSRMVNQRVNSHGTPENVTPSLPEGADNCLAEPRTETSCPNLIYGVGTIVTSVEKRAYVAEIFI